MEPFLKKFWIVLLIGVCVFSLSAEELGVLDGVMRPATIDVADGHLYMVDGEQIKIFSLDPIKLINTFGRQGEGPKEYKIIYAYPLRISVVGKQIMVESVDKLLFYSLKGEYQNEIKKNNNFSRVAVIGDRFVARKIVQNQQDNESSYSAVFIVDKEFNEIKELSRQPFLQQGGFPDIRINMEQDFLYFHVWEDKVYVEESQEGFVISVWDVNGKLLKKIKHDMPRVKITSRWKDRTIEEMKVDPYVVVQVKQAGGWNEFIKILTFNFPEYFPGIKSFRLSNGKLYVNTYAERDGKVEFVILDPEGKILEKKFIPPFEKPWVMSKLMGVRHDSINRDKVYFIEENDDEEWTLHAFDI